MRMQKKGVVKDVKKEKKMRREKKRCTHFLIARIIVSDRN